MRVLHVAPDISRGFGGPTVALLGFLAAGGEAGIRGEVAAPQPSAQDRAWFDQNSHGTPLHLFPTGGGGSARISGAMLRFLRDAGRRFDAVHIHGMFNGVSTLAALCCRAVGVPYVIGPFGTLSRYTFAYKRRLLKQTYHALLDAPAIRGAEVMHFTTSRERDEAMRLPAVRRVPSMIVPPPWVPDRSFQSGEHQDANAGEGREETVLFLSRLHPIKGLEVLIEAWPEVRAVKPMAQLVIAGSGEPAYERSLRARVAQWPNDGSIRFTGFVTGREKAQWLAAADVFVLPSHHENFGIAVLEAVAAGIPAVISHDVQLADVIAEHGLGAVVARRPDALARGIVRVLADDELRAYCAVEGPLLARSLFTPEATGMKLRAMYEFALSH